MSSLLSNDFNEEYFRLTKELNTNNQKIYVDRNNRIVFTPEFQTEDIFKVTQDFFSQNKIKPENANIIFDSVVFYSTNPDIQNYLPLKLSFGGKPQLEFSMPEFTIIEDFRITTDPPLLQAQVKNHRYGELNCLNIPTGVTGDLDAIIKWQKFIWYSQNGGAGLYLYKLEDNTNTLTSVPRIIEFKSNDINVVGLTTTNDALWNIVNDRLIVLVGGVPTEIIGEFQIKRDMLVYTTGEDTADKTGLNTFIYWVNLGELQDLQYRNININFYINYTKPAEEPQDEIKYQDANFLKFDIIDTDTIIAYVKFAEQVQNPRGIGGPPIVTAVDSYQLIVIRVTDFTQEVTHYQILDDITIFNPNDVRKIFSSGLDKSRPVGTIALRKGGNDNVFIRVDFTAFNPIEITEFKNVAPPVQYVKYINQVGWLDLFIGLGNEQYNFLNLDSRELVPYPWVIKNFQTFDFVPNTFFIDGSKFFWNQYAMISAFNSQQSIFISILDNERDVDKLVKLSFNYYERPFPFDVSSRDSLSFNITLPNKGTTPDLEIFQYVIDYRVRWTKQRLNPNPSVPNVKQPNKKFIKEGTVVKDTEDILGLVDPDQFNVQDFLQIYQTN